MDRVFVSVFCYPAFAFPGIVLGIFGKRLHAVLCSALDSSFSGKQIAHSVVPCIGRMVVVCIQLSVCFHRFADLCFVAQVSPGMVFGREIVG